MDTLLLQLSGPLQSWGSQSRFAIRSTEQAPTKSGVFGLLAAARGQRRTEPLTDLLKLTFGVRIDQPGRLIRDFQTERTLDGKTSMPLSYRYYLGDAVFLAGVESDDRGLLEGLRDALLRPEFPLYLGRRSCPPAGPLWTSIVDRSLEDALREAPWRATPRHQRSVGSRLVSLRVLLDADAQTPETETFRDEPISFDPARREYGWRQVRSVYADVENPRAPVTEPSSAPAAGGSAPIKVLSHDAMSLAMEGF